jgi:hypothetical protein
MNDQDYFNSEAIGSSLLANFIKGPDYALKEIKPSGAMEKGKIFEDLVEEEATGNPVFKDKYFVSSINSFPDTKKPNIKPILEILDSDHVGQAVEAGYIYKDNGDRNNTYKKRHDCLDQIKAHDYRRPIPAPDWEDLKAMLENFKLARFAPPEYEWEVNLFEMLSSPGARFQQTHFWKSGDAECRMKSDVEVFWEDSELAQYRGFVGDFKATGNWVKFKHNWKEKYIWQSKLYLEGFQRYCRENDIIEPEHIWYFIQESTAPYLLHMKALSMEEIDALAPKYKYSLNACQEWIDAGRPKRGYTDAEHVDRFLRSA